MKIKRRMLKAFSLIFLVVLIFVVFYFVSMKKIDYKNNGKYFDGNGVLINFPRGELNIEKSDFESNENYTITKLSYDSFGTRVYGLVLEPKVKNNVGVVLLPGAGVSKESELELAGKIAGLGYAVITIDQRGAGETEGIPPDIEHEFYSFESGNLTYYHLMAADALKAADVLRNEGIGKVIMIGESLGGRNAMIAAAVDDSIAGYIGISTAGFGYKDSGIMQQDNFMHSIDADYYIPKIAPRKAVMMHNTFDRNIPIDAAKSTFSLARQPKEFITINDSKCNHGYCGSFYEGLKRSLESFDNG